jgi:hypothetical protein
MTWKRTLFAAFLTLSTAFGATAWAQEKPGKIHIDFARRPSDPELKRVEFGLEASATEIYFGDAVCFRAFERNVLETPIERIGAFYSQIGGFAPYVGVDYSFMARGRR